MSTSGSAEERLLQEVGAAPCKRQARPLVELANAWIEMLEPMRRERLRERLADLIAELPE
jgi:hypothetical protein